MASKKIPMFFKNYMAMVQNSLGTKMFRNFFLEVSKKERDILEEGRLSCAVFASSILYLSNSVLEFYGQAHWIDFIHANVPSTEKDMTKNGWYTVSELRPGAVLIWEKINANGSQNWHMGFFLGNKMAISNDSGKDNTGVPHQPHYTYQDTRKIEKIYWHDELG